MEDSPNFVAFSKYLNFIGETTVATQIKKKVGINLRSQQVQKTCGICTQALILKLLGTWCSTYIFRICISRPLFTVIFRPKIAISHTGFILTKKNGFFMYVCVCIFASSRRTFYKTYQRTQSACVKPHLAFKDQTHKNCLYVHKTLNANSSL